MSLTAVTQSALRVTDSPLGGNLEQGQSQAGSAFHIHNRSQNQSNFSTEPRKNQRLEAVKVGS